MHSVQFDAWSENCSKSWLGLLPVNLAVSYR